MASFSNPRGMADILPEDWPYWTFVIDNAVQVAQLYGYHRIETPILGPTSLFARAAGAATDIVDKEMYSFRDRDGDEVSLRPEGTAPVMRAYLQHGWSRRPQPVKLFYIERMYRHDKPQRGRYREHRQFGCEAIGLDDAYVDVEMIALLDTFYRRLGLTDASLHINSIGDGNCRPAYLEKLVAYLRRSAGGLSEQDQERIERNPLRVLDSKDAASQRVIEGAPPMLEQLCGACQAHWEKLLHGLSLLGIAYEIDHRLVRGLDYYTRTVFEFIPPVDGRQAVLGAGGRYDTLSEHMGGRHVPGIGFGAGLERLILTLQERGIEPPTTFHPTVFVAHAGAGTEDVALLQAARLRGSGIPTDMAFGERSLKAQMRHADAEGAKVAVIVGEDEASRGTVAVRDLNSGEQTEVPADGLVGALEEAG